MMELEVINNNGPDSTNYSIKLLRGKKMILTNEFIK